METPIVDACPPPRPAPTTMVRMTSDLNHYIMYNYLYQILSDLVATVLVLHFNWVSSDLYNIHYLRN